VIHVPDSVPTRDSDAAQPEAEDTAGSERMNVRDSRSGHTITTIIRVASASLR